MRRPDHRVVGVQKIVGVGGGDFHAASRKRSEVVQLSRHARFGSTLMNSLSAASTSAPPRERR